MSFAKPSRKSLTWYLALWGAWLAFNTGYGVLRGFGDNLSAPHGIAHIETALFGGNVPGELQSLLYARDLAWLDYLSYLGHGVWFGLPFGFGAALMLTERERLLEFLAWTTVAAYLAVAVFLVFPVRPPWMEPGVERVLMVRNFGGYADIDNNPFAAFPSLHAGLPAAMALFFWMRTQKLRWCAWLLIAYTAWISFAVVYMGEHWVLDVLAGWLLAPLTALVLSPRPVRATLARSWLPSSAPAIPTPLSASPPADTAIDLPKAA